MQQKAGVYFGKEKLTTEVVLGVHLNAISHQHQQTDISGAQSETSTKISEAREGG